MKTYIINTIKNLSKKEKMIIIGILSFSFLILFLSGCASKIDSQQPRQFNDDAELSGFLEYQMKNGVNNAHLYYESNK